MYCNICQEKIVQWEICGCQTPEETALEGGGIENVKLNYWWHEVDILSKKVSLKNSRNFKLEKGHCGNNDIAVICAACLAIITDGKRTTPCGDCSCQP